MFLAVESDARGQWAVEFVRECLRQMFADYGAVTLRGGIHASNVACRKMVSLVHCGGKLTKRPAGFYEVTFTAKGFGQSYGLSR